MEIPTYGQRVLIEKTAGEMSLLLNGSTLTQDQLKEISLEQASKVGITDTYYFVRYVESVIPFKMEVGTPIR